MVYHYKFGIIVPYFKRNFRQLILAIAAFFMLSIGLSGLMARAVTPPNWTIDAGTEVTYVCGGQNYLHTFDTVVPGADGAFTGTGHYNADPLYTWNATGSIQGDELAFSITYTGTQSGSVYNATGGAISGDGSVAGIVDGGCQTFTMAAGSLDPIGSVTETEIDIYGNTTATENDAQKWMFNRDASTSTPYAFVNTNASKGNGSVHIKPIGANPSDKFVAEFFYLGLVSNVNTISYDFKTSNFADADQFYMNLYTNDGATPTEFYDCRYNIVPTTLNPDAVTGFTTVTYDLTAATDVTKRGTSSIDPCPSTPSALPAGAVLRAIAINVGDTSAADTGIEGYLDKVVVNADDAVTTYDLEPVTGTITNPVADGDVVSGTVNLTAVYLDGDADNDDAVQWAVRSGTCAPGMSTVLGNVDGFTTASMWDGKDFSASFDTTLVPNGSYCFVFNPTDDANQVDVRATRTFTVNNVVVVPDTTRPEVTINDPTTGEVLSGVVQVLGTIVDENPKDHRVRVFDDMGDRVFNGAWIADDGLTNQLADSFDSTEYPDGDYRIRLIARDESDNRRGANVWVVFDNYVDNKQECKNGGWTRGTFEGDTFRNQGQCVSFFERNNHKKPHRHNKGHVLSRVKYFSDWCRRNR